MKCNLLGDYCQSHCSPSPCPRKVGNTVDTVAETVFTLDMTTTQPHKYEAEGDNNRWRTCALCGRGANAGVHKTPAPSSSSMPAERVKLLRTAGQKVQEWTAERDRLIKDAVAAGGSLREVGEAVGLSHTAVKFIAHGRR